MSNQLGLDQEKAAQAGAADVDRGELEAKLHGGASWFYWIAGLSVINSLIYLSGSEWSFLAGLGLTQIAEAFVDVAIENGAPSAMKAVVIVFDLLLVGVFGLIGYYAHKLYSVAFIIGIVFYILDGLLLLLLGALPGAAFHAFALFFIIRGFLACRQLKSVPAQQSFQAPPPPPATL